MSCLSNPTDLNILPNHPNLFLETHPLYHRITSNNSNQLGSVTGRFGYAWDRFLGYVKVRAAWERIDYAMATAVAATNAFSARETGGWTVGIGGEYAITEWLSAFSLFADGTVAAPRGHHNNANFHSRAAITPFPPTPATKGC